MTAHGRASSYKDGCRCSECREANRVYQAGANARRAEQSDAADRAGHGKRSTYANYRCRCDACRAANSAACREYRERRRSQ